MMPYDFKAQARFRYHHASGVSLSSMGESCCCGRVKEEWHEPENNSPPPVFRDILRAHSPAGREASGGLDALTPRAIVFKDQARPLHSFEEFEEDASEKHADDAEPGETSEKDAMPWAEDEKHILEGEADSSPLGKQTSQASTSADDVSDWARSRLPTLIGDPSFGTARWADAQPEGISGGSRSYLEEID